MEREEENTEKDCVVLAEPLEDPVAEVVTTRVAVDEAVPEPEKVTGTEEPVVEIRTVEVSVVPVASAEEVLFRGIEPGLVEETRKSQSRFGWAEGVAYTSEGCGLAHGGRRYGCGGRDGSSRAQRLASTRACLESRGGHRRGSRSRRRRWGRVSIRTVRRWVFLAGILGKSPSICAIVWDRVLLVDWHWAADGGGADADAGKGSCEAPNENGCPHEVDSASRGPHAGRLEGTSCPGKLTECAGERMGGPDTLTANNTKRFCDARWRRRESVSLDRRHWGDIETNDGPTRGVALS